MVLLKPAIGSMYFVAISLEELKWKAHHRRIKAGLKIMEESDQDCKR